MDGVSWDLDRQYSAQAGLYQQFLGFASAGVLIMVASKRMTVPVDKALNEEIWTSSKESVPSKFIGLGKSESVQRIFETNIARKPLFSSTTA